MALQNELVRALAIFLDKGDQSPLCVVIREHPELVSTESGPYPDFHRIADIRVADTCYRVCRRISEGERIVLLPITEPDLNEPGVPIWLTGKKLREWACVESEDPAQDPTDWEYYK